MTASRMSVSPAVTFAVTRFTVEVDSTPREFAKRFEQAVPKLPDDRIAALVARRASWQEMIDLVDSAAPFGFFVYHRLSPDPLMRLAGDTADCLSYLMGNHTIAERMFRYEPSVLIYAPLRVAIWGDPERPAHFTFDRPSDHFSSFGNPDVAVVGYELDRKVGSLLEHLGAPIPDGVLD